MKPINNKKFDVKKCLELVQIPKEQQKLYRPLGSPADVDDAFIESLEVASNKLKQKTDLPKDSFES